MFRMDARWIFSAENSEEILKFCRQHAVNDNDIDPITRSWRNIHEFVKASNHVNELNSNVINLESTILSTNDLDKEQVVVDYIIEGLEEGSLILNNSGLDSLSKTSLLSVLSKLQLNLVPVKLQIFCKGLCDWGSSCPIVNIIFQEFILPEVKSLKGSAKFISELASVFPEQACYHLLIPMLEETDYDGELFASAIPLLGSKEISILLRKLLTKSKFEDLDWLLLHAILTDHSKHLDQQCWDDVTVIMRNSAENLSQHQNFAKILVFIAKQNQQLSTLGKDRIREAAVINKTLLKRQILKYLDS